MDTIDICENFHGGNPQSEAAHDFIMEHKSHVARRILTVLKTKGAATCDEVEVITGMKHQTVSARMSELKRDGYIVPTGEHRLTRGKCSAGVYKVCEDQAS